MPKNIFTGMHFAEVNPRSEKETEFITVEKEGERTKVVPRSAMENYISLDYKITGRDGRVLYDPVGYPYQVARKENWQPVVVENDEHMHELIEKGYTIEDGEGRVVAKGKPVEADFGEQLQTALNEPVTIRNRDTGETRIIKRAELAGYNTMYAWGIDLWTEIDGAGNEVKQGWKPDSNAGFNFRQVNSATNMGKAAADPEPGRADPNPFGFGFRKVNG